jgi:PIN domain nuclease of toxin-antitoxin system
MSNQLAQRMRSQQIEALKIQKEHMIVVRDRHQAWRKDPTDIEINRIRHAIIDSIEKTLAQYDQLLEALRRPIEEDK